MLRSILMSLVGLLFSLVFSTQIMAAPYTGGNALSFNPGQYVTIANSESLNPTQLTIESWVKFKPSFQSNKLNWFIKKNESYRFAEYSSASQGQKRFFHFEIIQSGSLVESVEYSSTNTMPNIWYHVAGTYDGDWMRFFLNGDMVSENQVGKVDFKNSIALLLGDLSGELDEVRIWSVVRTQDEISSSMYREIDTAPGLVSAWHFNEGTGSVVLDATGSNNGYFGSSPDVDINDPQWVQSTAPVTRDILVISPNGGEDLQSSSVETIRWFAFNTTAIDIDYSPDAGTTWKSVANQVDASSGSYPWTVPSELSSRGLIRITDSSNPDRVDVSDSLFTISQAYIQLLAPNGGEKWETETTHNIMWKSLGVNKINIDFSTDDGANWIPVISEVNAIADSIAWKVPFTPTSQGRVRIRNADSSLVSASESPFTIVQSSLVLLQPKGGDILEPGTVEDITWSSTPGVDSVKVEYSPDNGANWQFLVVTGASGLYHWLVPSEETTQGLIRVSWAGHPLVSVTVNSTFSIKTETPIEWTFYPSASTVKLLSVNGDAVWYVTDTNILRLNRKTAVIDTILPPNDFKLSQVVALVFDSKGTVWFGIWDCALWKFNGVNWNKYPVDSSHGQLTGLGIDVNDVKYFTTEAIGKAETYSLQSFDGSQWKIIQSVFTPGIVSFTHNSSILTVDNRRHSVWIENELGPEEILIDTGKTGISLSSIFDQGAYRPKQGVMNAYGDFWFASSKGYIYTYTGGNWIHFNADNSPIPWKEGSNFGITITPDNVKWFGGPGGLVRYDGSNWKIIPVSADSTKNSIWSLKVDADGNIWGITPDGIARYGYIPGPSSVNEKSEVPVAFGTITNYPNPFNPSTTIEFTLPSSGKASLVIYDIMGRKVRELISGQISLGMRTVFWDGRDDSGGTVSSGVYFARLTIGKSVAMTKMLMMK
jgi:streptogramin lyase